MTATKAPDRHVYDNLDAMLGDISPNLRKYAAQTTGTWFADLAGMDQEAQDLYQHAVMILVKDWKPGQTAAYWVTRGQWRMDTRTQRERIYAERVTTDPDDAMMTDDEADSFLDAVADTAANPEDLIVTADHMVMIGRIKDGLKPEYALMVTLLAQGCPLTEIAARLGIEYDAAWKRVAKIRAAFEMAGMTPATVMA